MITPAPILLRRNPIQKEPPNIFYTSRHNKYMILQYYMKHFHTVHNYNKSIIFSKSLCTNLTFFSIICIKIIHSDKSDCFYKSEYLQKSRLLLIRINLFLLLHFYRRHSAHKHRWYSFPFSLP